MIARCIVGKPHAMSLSAPVEREHIHSRTVECRGFRRADGLWDIEGHMTDTKTYGFDNEHRGRIEPGEPIHDMWMRLTVDDTLTIKAVEVKSAAGPFAICPAIEPAYQQLIGLQLRGGFTRKSREALGGAKGCTHLTELLGPVATTAFQTVFPILAREREDMRAVSGDAPRPGNGSGRSRRPLMLNSCHAFAEDSPLVKDKWPEHYAGNDRPNVDRPVAGDPGKPG